MLGSNSKSFSKRFMAGGAIFLRYLARSFGCFRSFSSAGMLTCPVRRSFSSLSPSQVSKEGVPNRSKISCSWSISVLPVKSGFPINNSARIQPALQTSTGGPYLVAPIKISGGRYQRVMTLFVNSCDDARLRPKAVPIPMPIPPPKVDTTDSNQPPRKQKRKKEQSEKRQESKQEQTKRQGQDET